MTRKTTWFTALILGATTLAQAETVAPSPAQETAVAPSVLLSSAGVLTNVNAAPVRDVHLPFAKLAPAPGNFTLSGIQPDGYIEFGVRSDEVVTQATLSLEYTPSPALIPVESQVKIYLNDELMQVISITQEQMGKSNQVKIPIDPRFITDFNRIRLEFIGHYERICENPASTTLWLDVSRSSGLDLRFQSLPLKNELSPFPVPFFDAFDTRPLNLPVVFAAQPDLEQQRAAGILASWFGSKAEWRGQSFPVLYNQLPDRHAIILATNQLRPDFLRDYPSVNAPTVEIISHPDNPYVKLLLVLGRDDKDLVTAVQGIAQGTILLRGQNATVDKVQQLAPRQPYDAPNWVRTDRAVNFSELQQYNEQLQTTGMTPPPISLTLNLPPDLYLIRSNGIDMRLKYRYTAPRLQDGSRLAVSLNDKFVESFRLTAQRDQGSQLMRLPLLREFLDDEESLSIPALRLGSSNQLKFSFDYATLLASNPVDRCETYVPIVNHAVIDGNSTIDLSAYRHFIAMPDLSVFANAGFPFSRMADLSETLVLVGPNPQPVQVSALLNALGNIGSQTGYPALGFRLSDDWRQAEAQDADVLLIGVLPKEMRDESRINLLLDETRSWVKQPLRQSNNLAQTATQLADAQPVSRTDITSEGQMAALIGFQSPFHSQRSVVAMLADGTHGYQLLNEALQDSGKRAAMFGSVSVIRDSGVNSLRVGDIYYVGYLPWWERIWHMLATHPVLLALVAAVAVVLVALMLWRGLHALSRRRLTPDERD